jgi:hypothetical protein
LVHSVAKHHQQRTGQFSDEARSFFLINSSFISAAFQNGELQQAKVSIMSNLDCKAIETPGKYATDNTLCITSTFVAIDTRIW